MTDPRRKADGTWKKGVSGAPGNHNQGKHYLVSALRKYAKEHPEDVDAVARLSFDVAAGRQHAKKGQVDYAKWIADRLDGSITQQYARDERTERRLVVEGLAEQEAKDKGEAESDDGD